MICISLAASGWAEPLSVSYIYACLCETISITTRKGTELKLERGGSVLKVDGKETVANPGEEYEAIYERFAKLLKKGKSEMDGSPLRLIGDAFLLGARENVDEFHW